MQQEPKIWDEKINVVDNITIFKYIEILTDNPDDSSVSSPSNLTADEDGDLSLPRRNALKKTLLIEHSAYTDVDLVGLQVWNGALLLSDFILDNKEKFTNKRVLEFGSGTGLVGIVAAKFCENITFTDIDNPDILNTIQKNVETNKSCLKAKYQIIPFDFSQEWCDELKNIISKTDLFLASELIYDDDISLHFVLTLLKIFSLKRIVTCYFSVEKRFVFTVTNQRVEAKHYDYFFDILNKKLLNASIPYELNQVKEISQYFYEYDRNKNTELWRISLHP